MPSLPPIDTLVAVSHSGSGDIRIYRPASDWTRLEPVQTLGVGAGRATPVSIPMAYLPRRRTLLAALRSAPWPLVGYRFDSTTHLFVAFGEAALNGSAPYIAATLDEGALLSVINPGAAAFVQPFADHGLPATSGAGHDGIPKAHCVTTANGIAYVASVNGHRIHQFVLESGGLRELAPPVSLSGKGDPRHLALDPDGQTLYAVTEAAGTVVHFEIAGDGQLIERSSVSVWPAGIGVCEAADIAVTGSFVFVTERRSSTIAVLKRSTDGSLKLLRLVATGGSPRAIGLSPDQSFLAVAAELSDTVFVYRIDTANGELVETCTIAVGATPNWITMISIEGPVS